MGVNVKVSVRSSNYVTEGANYKRRYDALFLSNSDRKMVSCLTKKTPPKILKRRRRFGN